MRVGQFIQLVYYLKKSDEYPVAFRRFAKKEGKRANIAKDVKTWLSYVSSEVFLR